ncbi:MAG: nuclear transport factor 2 family protein [Casimicrobiaceae bacterium]
MNAADATARIVAFFEQLVPADAERIGDFYAADAYFRDPFNDVRGTADISRVFQHMFDQLADCRFVISETVGGVNGAMLVWDFTFRIRSWRPDETQTIHGATHVRFAADGKVAYHRDYWDAAGELYAKLPVIGAVMRFLQRKLA